MLQFSTRTRNSVFLRHFLHTIPLMISMVPDQNLFWQLFSFTSEGQFWNASSSLKKIPLKLFGRGGGGGWCERTFQLSSWIATSMMSQCESGLYHTSKSLHGVFPGSDFFSFRGTKTTDVVNGLNNEEPANSLNVDFCCLRSKRTRPIPPNL